MMKSSTFWFMMDVVTRSKNGCMYLLINVFLKIRTCALMSYLYGGLAYLSLDQHFVG